MWSISRPDEWVDRDRDPYGFRKLYKAVVRVCAAHYNVAALAIGPEIARSQWSVSLMSDSVRAMDPRLDEAASAHLVEHIVAIRDDPAHTVFTARQAIAERLGAHYDPSTGLTRFGFWAPGLASEQIVEREVAVECFTPLKPIDFSDTRIATEFVRRRIPLLHDGDYWWGVVSGLRAGTREQCGTLYWLRAETEDGEEMIVRDLVAHSIPFGSFAPAELYDMETLQAEREDLAHFSREATAPSSILEIHVPTATESGSIGELAERFRGIASRMRADEPLTAADLLYAPYDAVQLMPVDPTIERPSQTATFTVTDDIDEMDGVIGVLLMHPDNLNWGYDNIVASSSAVNPSLLRSKRPHEMVDLATALHAMPDPVMLIFDIVYGHADNQATRVLPSRFFKGPNMYGMDLNHQDPTVRAILLEMQRRRMNLGCDGLRVDGAQDFKFYDPRTGRVEYDDDYLQSMSDVPQRIGTHERRVWMIFEDGRPWPAEGWETESTYRDVIQQQPDVWQWGPLIFAHNTPMLRGFWATKFDRVEEMMRLGGRWISGCGNHDTVRRGTQVPVDADLNEHLGEDLPAILDAAYDSEAVNLVMYGFLPGIPMDFLNATARGAWGFMRTTDDVYGVKVMAEDASFMRWQVRDVDYAVERAFHRTKRHGFPTRQSLIAFFDELNELVEETEYDLDAIRLRIDAPAAIRPGRHGLHLLASDYMRDVHDVCKVDGRFGALDSARVEFAADLRRLRREQLWLRDDARTDDRIELHRPEDRTIYRGRRTSPDGATSVLLLANMAGPTLNTSLGEWLDLPTAGTGTRYVLSPSARMADGEIELPDGTGVLVLRRGVD